MDCLHTNHTSIYFLRVNRGATAIGHKACLLMTIKFTGKNNKVRDALVLSTKLLTRLESMEGLVLIDSL